MGGKYNMGYREAAYAAALILPDVLLPIHHGTFPNQVLDLDRLEAEMKVRAPRVRLVRLQPGGSFEIGGQGKMIELHIYLEPFAGKENEVEKVFRDAFIRRSPCRMAFGGWPC